MGRITPYSIPRVTIASLEKREAIIMYRPTYTDKAGHVRKYMRYYGLNKVQSAKYPELADIKVEARNKVSAYRKFQKVIDKKYYGLFTVSNLAEIPYSRINRFERWIGDISFVDSLKNKWGYSE